MRAVNKMASLLSLVILVGLIIFVVWRNYTPGIFLIGWDSLHPEFNFSEAFKRVFFGVWREEQGVGVVAAHSHMADWPRILLLWLSSFILPASFLRYFYIFICLILGPLGVYFFLLYVFRREKEGLSPLVGAFLGAFYYLLNVGTLQYFFVPFEMFTTQYAFLPWLFYFALRFLREGKRVNLVFFAVLTVISSPQAYAATLFYVYLGALIIFVLFYRFKRGLILIILTLLLNFYWILPNIYSVFNQSDIVIKAKINRLFSPEASLRSLDYSDWGNVVIHKNFLFDWRAFDFEKGEFTDLLGVWTRHLQKIPVLWLTYLLSALSGIGILFSLFKKDRMGIGVFVLILYALFFLIGPKWDLSIFREALRMPFTKFSILLLFGMSFFFGYFFFKLVRRVFIGVILTLIVGGGLILSLWPVFQGKLISSVVKRDVPAEYFELFKWFKDKPGRVASLPLNTLWGWDFYSWKYEGSGFLTYGLSNPLLIRDFDRWSKYNEGFYAESAWALYASDGEAFERTLQKYQVKYLLLDESIINAGGSPEVLFIPEIKEMLSGLGIEEIFKSGFLTVYDTRINTKNVSAPPTYARVNVDLDYSRVDPVYEKFGDYIQDSRAIGYPFVNFDPRGPVTIKISNDKLQIANDEQNAKVVLSTKGRIEETFGEGRGFGEAYNCDLKKLGRVEKAGKTYRAFDGGVSCDFFEYPNLKYGEAYILRIKGENKRGRSLKMYLQNWKTGRMDLEELLPKGAFDEYFVILPENFEGGGYTLNLETRSFGGIASENIIEKIEIYPINYQFLSNIYTGEKSPVSKNNLKINNVKKYGTWMYKVDVEGYGLMQLGLGYENGWLAFRAGVTRLEHVKVNSWANGFVVPPNIQYPVSSIYIFFWPQLLEWLGFVILFGGLIVLVCLPVDTAEG